MKTKGELFIEQVCGLLKSENRFTDDSTIVRKIKELDWNDFDRMINFKR